MTGASLNTETDDANNEKTETKTENETENETETVSLTTPSAVAGNYSLQFSPKSTKSTKLYEKLALHEEDDHVPL